MSLEIQLPSERVAHDAGEAVRALNPLLTGAATLHIHRADGTGLPLALPQEALTLLVRILAHMANGDAITLVPIQAEITTQQAADLLNVSRPFLIGLLDEEKIPYRRIGTHRRVSLRGLLAFKHRDDQERRAIADALTAEAQASGFGY